jgi:UPF0042 nucleotide-binding protein
VTALIELIDTSDPRTARLAGTALSRLRAAELIRRFNQTRRSHPLAPAEDPEEASSVRSNCWPRSGPAPIT